MESREPPSEYLQTNWLSWLVDTFSTKLGSGMGTGLGSIDIPVMTLELYKDIKSEEFFPGFISTKPPDQYSLSVFALESSHYTQTVDM